MRFWLFYFAVAFAVVGGGTGAAPTNGWAQIEELSRPDSAHARSFGESVALGDSLAVVGASGEAECGTNAGAVYVYERRSGAQFDSWRPTARLAPQTCRPNAFFGEHVALSGERILVSASSEHFANEGTNSAYVFERTDAGAWRQTARFTGEPNRKEGLYAADLDLEGDRAVVSTSGNPAGAYGGAVYVYDYNPAEGEWTQSGHLTASRGPGAGVLGNKVVLDGDRVAVAASTYFDRGPGSVYVFRYDPSTDEWQEDAFLRDVDAFFIDLDLDDSTLLVGEDQAGEKGAGQATIYAEFSDHTWMEKAVLRPSRPYESGSFGTAVSLEGSWALVTGYDEQLEKDFNIDRVVYVFRRRDETWWEHTILDIGEVGFGAALDQNGSRAIISSVPAKGTGSVYVVQLR